jgi:signal transduction histidine kinase
MKVKLLTLTLRNYMLAFLSLLVVFFGVFYLILRSEVTHNIDEILYNRKNNLIILFERENDEIQFDKLRFTDFRVEPINRQIEDSYSDTLIFEATDQEFDEYRKLITSFRKKDQNYKLEIVKAHLESGEIIDTILMSLGLIFLMMLIVFYFTSRYFSTRLWKPFNDTLLKLKSYEADKPLRLSLPQSKVEEFDALNNSITELTDRVQNAFQSQKQFIENASHEMQTPLAIIQNQLELVITDPGLTETQSEKIKTVLDSTQRITKLNKALQLISKIENSQFVDIERCDLKPVVEKVLTYFEGEQENLEIKLGLNVESSILDANPTLLEILITNVIKNAFLHNVKNGFVNIVLKQNTLTVTNTSKHFVLPKEKIFQRFFKQGQHRESWGLGLSISRQICQLNDWQLLYSADATEHTFTVHFNRQRT